MPWFSFIICKNSFSKITLWVPVLTSSLQLTNYSVVSDYKNRNQVMFIERCQVAAPEKSLPNYNLLIVMPPSTITTWPVEYGNLPVDMAAATLPTSSGSPQRLWMVNPSPSNLSYFSVTPAVISVRI